MVSNYILHCCNSFISPPIATKGERRVWDSNLQAISDRHISNVLQYHYGNSAKLERQDSNLRPNGFTLLRYRYFLYQLRYFPNFERKSFYERYVGGKLQTTETGLVGFEPTYHGVKVRCLTTWR